jgi:hypothetical protein
MIKQLICAQHFLDRTQLIAGVDHELPFIFNLADLPSNSHSKEGAARILLHSPSPSSLSPPY